MATARGRAFGLDLAVDFACPGLPPAASRPGTEVRVRRAGRADLLARYGGGERLWGARRDDGRLAARFEAHPRAGYLLAAEGYGTFGVSRDATLVECAGVRTAPWRWQRYLIGQVLPFVAVLRGLEVFHASAVRLGDAGVAFVGPSRAGKSTLAISLVLRGAGFVADDVVAVDPAAGEPEAPLLAEHGWGLTSLRHEASGRLAAPDGVAALGSIIGVDDEATRVAVDVERSPLPVRAIYVVLRDRSATAGPVVEPMAVADPRLLLASSYNFVIRTPERLVRHLDVCARLARTAAVARVRLHPDVAPDAVAAAVEDHAAALERS